MLICAGLDISFDICDLKTGTEADPEEVLLNTGKWKEIDGKLYFTACVWFYFFEKALPLCWGGLHPSKGVEYPDCLHCRSFEI